MCPEHELRLVPFEALPPDPGDEPDPSGYLPREDRMEHITVEDVLEKVELARERYR